MGTGRDEFAQPVSLNGLTDSEDEEKASHPV